MKKKIIAVSTALVILGFIVLRLVSNYSHIQESKAAPKSNSKAISVTTTTVVRKSMNQVLQVVGNTVGIHEVVLQAEVPAQVIDLHYSVGNFVKKGQLLVQLNDRMQALSYENAKLNLSRLEDEYNRTKNLYTGKVGTETQLRDSKVAYENARVALDQAKRQLELTRICAPFDGYIYQNFTEKGAFVGVGGQLLALSDIGQLKISASIAERDVYKLHIGQAANITAAVYPGKNFSGHVTFISPKADKWHNYASEITMNNPRESQLRSGTFVNAALNLGNTVTSLVIPRKALVGSMKDAAVFLVNNNTATLRKITIGADFADYLEVTDGLMENDEIVVTGQINLTNGSQISK
ncbi:MAG: efflux RND transporter periplasmic adaptor subunit [Ignavibacteria bacterium]|nr:efflux RND transporter periplasmic adaptor subunit [Ignavibacteria bacterium]